MIVIKLGGNALAATTESDWIAPIKETFITGTPVILVHGGGPQIDQEFSIHQIEKVVRGGYRVTDAAAFEVVEMVLAGKVQQTLVRLLNAAGLPAVGVTGSDGGTFHIMRKKSPEGIDLGQVGEVVGVNRHLLESLLEKRFLPVFSPVSSGADGMGFNVNADLAAGALAGSFNAERAIFMTDVAGIYRNFPAEDSLISRSSVAELDALLPSLSEGMIPKVEAVINAINAGARRAHIIDGRDGKALSRLLDGQAVGTEVTRD